MTQMKYLNAILTVIAVCLVLIVLATTGLLPVAQAESTKKSMSGFVQVPVNEDGSVNARISPASAMDVNIESVDADAFFHAEPIEVRIK